jgi:4-methyl-5(b-hydroxyethyl)-thiazole monophosphate biosynthesis
MKKVALYLAEGFEEVEALATVDILRRGGIQVDTISIGATLEVMGSHNIPVRADRKLSDVFEFNEYQMMILPGGMPGTINLSNNDRLKEIILSQNEKKKYIAAICAAPMILGKLGLLQGKEATCYPGVEENLIGATYREDKNVVVEENIITSRGMGTVLEFALKLVEILSGKENSEAVSKAILFS